MPKFLLPPDTHLHSDKPITLALRPDLHPSTTTQPPPITDLEGFGQVGKAPGVQSVMSPLTPMMFPDFYVKSEELHAILFDHHGVQVLPRDLGDGKFPALPTSQGLVFDTDWAPFTALVSDYRQGPSALLVKGIETRKTPWDLQCPVMKGYTSIIGHLIEQYGYHTGGDPDREGMNDTDFMRDHPLRRLLANANQDDLVAFSDRGQTLLDIACHHQQWDLAKFLWGKGVRWSTAALSTGTPLQSLIVASRGLRDMMLARCNDDLQQGTAESRIQWLETWLDRYVQSAGATNPKPALDWRARLAHARNWEGGKSLVDSPASFWISRFTQAGQPGHLVAIDRVAPHAREVVEVWARFWARQGVDLDQVEVPRGGNEKPPATGMEDFWSTTKNSEPWMDLIRTITQQAVLDTQTPTSTRAGHAPRL